MTTKAKIAVGIVAGAAVGICIGILMSDTELIESMKESLTDAGDKISRRIKELMNENSDGFGELRLKLSDEMRSA